MGGFSLFVTVSAPEGLGGRVLKFRFVLCIYLSPGVVCFVLGKSSYNLMIFKKNFLKELKMHTNRTFPHKRGRIQFLSFQLQNVLTCLGKLLPTLGERLQNFMLIFTFMCHKIV